MKYINNFVSIQGEKKDYVVEILIYFQEPGKPTIPIKETHNLSKETVGSILMPNKKKIKEKLEIEHRFKILDIRKIH